jgi:hypothetical protein
MNWTLPVLRKDPRGAPASSSERGRLPGTQPTFALLVLALCRRAGGTASHAEGTADTLTALDELTARDHSLECRPLRQVLLAALDVHRELEAGWPVRDSLSPGTIIQLDAILAATVRGTMPRSEMRPALRRAFIRPASQLLA